MTRRESATVIISILLALIVKGALEIFFKPIFEGDKSWSEIPALHWGQLTLCFVLVFRFYLGATRFIDTEPKQVSFFIKAANLIFSFLLFCAFYCAALAAADPGYFYPIILALHIIDAIWFTTALVFSYFHSVPPTQLEQGEVKIEAVRRVMWTFFSLSILTIIYGLASYRLLGESISSQSVTTSHWFFLIFLFTISLVDFLILQKYYFRFADWQQENQAA